MLTIYAYFLFQNAASYISKKYSDFCYNGFMCKHVYENLGPGPCPFCGLPTHSINWVEQNKMMKEYKDKVGFFYNTSQWWSI